MLFHQKFITKIFYGKETGRRVMDLNDRLFSYFLLLILVPIVLICRYSWMPNILKSYKIFLCTALKGNEKRKKGDYIF